jgi:hypothetical protein
MFSNNIVVIKTIHSFKEEVLFGRDGKQFGDIKLLVIGTMGTFNMSVLLGTGSMVLDNGTAKAGKEFSKFDELEPGFAAKLFTPVNRKDNGHRDAVTSEPGKHPQKEGQSIGPAFLIRVSHQFETGVDIDSAPFVERGLFVQLRL